MAMNVIAKTALLASYQHINLNAIDLVMVISRNFVVVVGE